MHKTTSCINEQYLDMGSFFFTHYFNDLMHSYIAVGFAMWKLAW